MATGRDEPLILPDTNIIVHYIRDDAVKHFVEKGYKLLLTDKVPLTNWVIEAETRSIASGNSWGVRKNDQLRFLFSTFRRISIENSDTLDAYVAIDPFSRANGITMGKNDLWIAATASITGAVLLTMDRDFDHLDPAFLTRIWIDPTV